ncbi:MAG: HsdM family class I SAM-dependent methyltransferase, partial [Candidatus Binatia bacterium]
MLDPDIARHLRANREQQEVVGPLVAYLIDLGWNLGQLRFGSKEWRVPKTPSEATKRERGQSFDGFPVDIAIFDHPDHLNDPRHLAVIIETKSPDEEAGVSQLEIYMSREPHVQLGIWTNSADPTAPAVFVYRATTGKSLVLHRPLDEIPGPGDRISPEEKKQRFGDLTTPSSDAFRRVVDDILDHVVATDSRVTRREEQLDQICNLLLLKLESDKTAKATSGQPYFRLRASAAETAEAMRQHFRDLVVLYPGVFREPSDRQLRFADSTIHSIVERIAPYRLIDAGVTTIATAFQSLRTDALKQGEGQYFTPQQVIEAGVKVLRVDWNDLVIDPACGTGGFLVEVLLQMQARYPGRPDDLARWAQSHIYGIDKDAIAVKLTKAIMQIAGDGSAHCVRGDSILTHTWATDYPELAGADYANGRFSVVVTNPPFGKGLK